jgi:predicted flap endonuclease-1-like 5' DNA nuclease
MGGLFSVTSGNTVETFFAKIFLCLLAAAAIGFFMAWWWRRLHVLEEQDAHTKTKQALTSRMSLLSEAQVNSEAATGDLSRREMELYATREQLTTTEKQVQTLTVDNENRLRQVASLSADASNRESQLASLSANLLTHQTVSKERTTELQASNARVLDLEKQITELRQALVEKTNLAGQAQANLLTREESLATIQSKLANSDHIAHDLLKAKDDQLAAERRQCEQTLLANAARIKDLQSQLAVTHSESEQIQTLKYRVESLVAVEREFEGVRKTLTNRTQLLTESQEQITRLKMELERATQSRGQFETQIRELTSAKQSLNSKLESAERLAHKLPRQFSKPPEHKDDIKHIYGVGPALEKLLNELGVYHFRQVATWTEADIDFFDGQLHEFHGRIRRENWVLSAIEEHYKKYGEWLGQGAAKITMPETNRH